jgi:pyruvate/2-oxoglutarate dehydrogenase complex dihydrolipoamide dehydrogenase (E3) component
VTVADFLGHEEHVKEAFHASIAERLNTLNAEIFRGTGSFVDAHTIRVELNVGNT